MMGSILEYLICAEPCGEVSQKLKIAGVELVPLTLTNVKEDMGLLWFSFSEDGAQLSRLLLVHHLWYLTHRGYYLQGEAQNRSLANLLSKMNSSCLCLKEN